MSNGVQATAVTSGTGDSAVRGPQAGLMLAGFSARESAGSAAAAEFNIRNGAADTAPVIAHCSLAADGEKTVVFPIGIKCTDGIFLERTAGTCEVVVYSYP